MRRALPFEREYREADVSARAIVSTLARPSEPESAPIRSAGEPTLDPLPPPKLFIAIAAAALVAAAAAFAASRRGRTPSARRRFPVAAVILAAAVIAASGLAIAAALERRDSYAVVWTERVRVIPSPEAELEVRVPLGSTAKLRLEALGFSSLAFADGVEAWAPSESLYKY